MQEENFLDKFIYNFSRVAILIPILFIVMGVSMKVMGFNFATPQSALAQITPTPAFTASDNNIFSNVSAGETKIDLKGPLICSGTFNAITADVKIKDYSIAATLIADNRTRNIIVEGDCLYHWFSNTKTGQKMCGISQYMPMINLLSQFNMLDIKTIFSLIPNMNTPVSLDDNDAQQLAQSCAPGEITDSVFNVPAGITFSNMALSPSVTGTR